MRRPSLLRPGIMLPKGQVYSKLNVQNSTLQWRGGCAVAARIFQNINFHKGGGWVVLAQPAQSAPWKYKNNILCIIVYVIVFLLLLLKNFKFQREKHKQCFLLGGRKGIFACLRFGSVDFEIKGARMYCQLAASTNWIMRPPWKGCSGSFLLFEWLKAWCTSHCSEVEWFSYGFVVHLWWV